MLMVLVGMIFLLSNHPAINVMCLILVSIFYTIWLYLKFSSFWISSIILLVMLSGVLVLFSYMVSFSPNESFEAKKILGLFFIVFLWCEEKDFLKDDMSYYCLKLWSSLMMNLNIFMLAFLVAIMMLVILFTQKFSGSFRV